MKTYSREGIDGHREAQAGTARRALDMLVSRAGRSLFTAASYWYDMVTVPHIIWNSKLLFDNVTVVCTKSNSTALGLDSRYDYLIGCNICCRKRKIVKNR